MLTDAQIQEGNIQIDIFFTNRIIIEKSKPLKIGRKRGSSIQYLNYYDISDVSDLKYHTSWDLQIPVWSKLAHESKELVAKLDEFTYKWWLKICEKYETAIYNDNPQQGFTVLLELLTWYKNNKV